MSTSDLSSTSTSSASPSMVEAVVEAATMHGAEPERVLAEAPAQVDGEIQQLLLWSSTEDVWRDIEDNNSKQQQNEDEKPPELAPDAASSSSKDSSSTTSSSFPSLIHEGTDSQRFTPAFNNHYAQEAVYGNPLSVEQAQKRMPVGDENGLTWNVLIVPDEWWSSPARGGGNGVVRGLNPHDFDVTHQCIKPRRPSLPVTASDFVSSLTRVPKRSSIIGVASRFIFHGILNGWPSLKCLELISLEQRKKNPFPSPKELLSGQLIWQRVWHVDREGEAGVDPRTILLQDFEEAPETTTTEQQSFAQQQRRRSSASQSQASPGIYRAVLRGAPWTRQGWSPESPGFCFWFESQHSAGPRLLYGSDLVDAVNGVDEDSRCTHIHMISHRYAVPRESPKDKLTYHSVCMLEWNHGLYSTVVEMAFLNGMGGYKGKSNWYHDRDVVGGGSDGGSSLYQALPPELICPWRTTSAEVRCYDVPMQSLDDMKAFVQQYRGSNQRFVDPHFTFSHVARLTFRSKRHIAQYLLNYISRDSTYAELRSNCQTFAADFCCFVAGKKNVQPFHPVSRIEYYNRTYLFLYDSNMYESKDEKKRKKQLQQQQQQQR